MSERLEKIKGKIENLKGNPYYMMAIKDVLGIIDSEKEESISVSNDVDTQIKKQNNEIWQMNDSLRSMECNGAVNNNFTFKAIPRLLDMIEPTDRAKQYVAKLADTLEKEGYITDAKIVRESVKIMSGEKVAMATMDEEPVSIDFEKELYKAFGQVKDFTLGMRIANWFYDMGKNNQEPVSEDLEEAVNTYIGYPPEVDECSSVYGKRQAFKAGAEWGKNQAIAIHQAKEAVKKYRKRETCG